MNRAVKQSGFTLIELLLAMSFISILLLAIAMTIIQIGNIYNRGMILKEINQVARSLSSDISRTIAASEPFALDESSRKYIATDAGGRLCLGQYSYIWNYAKALDEDSRDLNVYASETDPIRFIKVPDIGSNYCSGDEDYQQININGAVDLLRGGDRDLSIHSFTIHSNEAAVDSTTGQRLYTIILDIGTSEVEALTEDMKSCKPPSIPGSDLAYCSVQEFSIVVRAGNRSS